MKQAGLATHFVHSEMLPALEQELQRQGAYMQDAAAVDAKLSSFEVSPGCCHGLET